MALLSNNQVTQLITHEANYWSIKELIGIEYTFKKKDTNYQLAKYLNTQLFNLSTNYLNIPTS